MRKKLHVGIILLAVLAAFPCAGAAAPPAVDFNDARLQSGRDLYQLKRYLEAIDQFRVAAFGYLDQPPVLTECLARLVLAQSAAGRPQEADVTIQRFLEVQRRFPSYPPKGLDAETQSEFRAALLKSVPESTLQGIPSLAQLVDTEEQKLARLAPADRRKALESAARRDPQSVTWPLALARDSLQRSDPKDAEKWAQKAQAIDASNVEARVLLVRARVMRGDLSAARSDLTSMPPSEFDKRPELYADLFVVDVDASDWAGAEAASPKIPSTLLGRADVARARQKMTSRPAPRPTPPPSAGAVPASSGSQTSSAQASASSSVPPRPTPDTAAIAARSREVLIDSRRLVAAGKAADASKVLSAALTADPGNRELRLALLEAACLSRSYGEGASQVSLVSPFAENEGPSMFYAAVVLYETGKTDEARGLMKRAAPRVSGPLVDEYSRKILGQ